jgi:hypothetical protein
MRRFWIACGFTCLTLLPSRAVGQIAPETQRIAQAGAPAKSGTVKLELHTAGGRTQFHMGEAVTLELTVTSEESTAFRIQLPGCGARATYQLHLDPGLVDRLEESEAAMYGIDIVSCGGGIGDVDLREKPIHEQMDLNDWFRIDAPGAYHISITSSLFLTTSNTIELEILPRDQGWEKIEFERASALIAFPRTTPAYAQGCRQLQLLETADAIAKLAKLFAQGKCADHADHLFMSPANRRVALGALQEAVSDPDTAMSPLFVRVLAFLSLYEQHPDWYPEWPRTNDSFNPLASPQQRISPSRLSTEGDAVAREELRVEQQFLSALPKKSAAARAESLKGFLFLGAATGLGPTTPLPAEMENVARDLLPSLFEALPEADQEAVLRTGWLGVKSPAMIPVLKRVVENSWHNLPLGIAIQRLYELSPSDGRQYVLNELSSFTPRLGIDVLGILPDKELPELDRIALRRITDAVDHKANTFTAADFIGRYASRAIENGLLELVAAHPTLVYESVGAGECETEADLLSYFVRVDPEKGKAMLERAMNVDRDPRGCHAELLPRLPESFTSPEIEDVAVAALDDPEPRLVQGALGLLRRGGTIKAKQALSDHFQTWHDAWKNRSRELDQPNQRDQRMIESVYFQTLTAAYGWIASTDEVRAFAGFCVSQECKDVAMRRAESMGDDTVLGIRAPAWEDLTGKVSIGPYYDVIRTIERLETKMSQYPKGTTFRIAPQVSRDAAQRLYDALAIWVADHGFRIQLPSP